MAHKPIFGSLGEHKRWALSDVLLSIQKGLS